VRVIAGEGVHEIEIQRSRFLCSVARVADDQEAGAFIARVRKEHWSATHNCSAFRVGPDGGSQRSNDDGEPAGTAGVPMLEVLLRRELTDTVAVVTRYYGGVKLGAGGLVRAYRGAVSETVDAVGTVRRARFVTMKITAEHTDAGRLENALHAAGHRLANTAYGQRVYFTVYVPDADVFTLWLAEQTGGSVTATIGPPIDLVLQP
jgi:uncharacterized YigZ family protein